MFSIDYDRHRLDNGLTVILSRDEAIPIVAVNLWYGVGSRNERPGRTGFAHLFEHMMFQGSAHVPKNRHFELIERAGGSLNASTWFDRTNYFETVPSHHLELALWLESDRMGWLLPAMTSEKLENQRDVVLNERKQRYENQPYGDWDERLQALLFPEDHPYHHTVIGSVEDIKSASLADVEEFFRTYYVPGNAVLTICGDFEAERARELVEAYFGEIPEGGVVPPLPGEVELAPTIGETRKERVPDSVPLPRTYLAYRIPPFSDPRFHQAEVAAAVLADGKASRLYSSLVRERKLAKDVVAYAFPLVTGATMLLVAVTGHAQTEADTLEEALFEEIEGLSEVRASEVDRAVALSETRLVNEVERVGARADLLSLFQTHFDDPGRLNEEMDRLRAVTREDVRAFAAEFLGPDNRALVTYVPEDER